MSPAADKKEPKSGFMSSEFVLAFVTIVLATVLVLNGRLDGNDWMGIAGAATGAYSVSRALVKR